MKRIIAATAFAALLAAAPAMAADTSIEYQPNAATNSGPGVKGAVGGKNGPSAKPDHNNGSSSSSNGASSGEQGTMPSQDSSGVAGATGGKNGPAAKEPSDTDTSQ